jgi:hypothetical protein
MHYPYCVAQYITEKRRTMQRNTALHTKVKVQLAARYVCLERMFQVLANMNLIISHMLHCYRVLVVLSWRKTKKNNTRTGERERDAQAQQLITSVSTRSLTDAASAARTGR